MNMRTHTFRGIRYRIHTDLVMDGYAEAPGPRKPREIYVSAALQGRRHLEVALHEAMHAEDPDVPEAVIDRRARALSRFLWRLGYRRAAAE